MSLTDTTELFRQAQQAQFDLLLDQLKQLDEWMSKDFSEVDFKVTVDSHVDAKELTVTLTFLTSNEMSPNDRLFKKLELKWDEPRWNNPNTIVQIGHIADRLKQSIAQEINNWYAKRKMKDEATGK